MLTMLSLYSGIGANDLAAHWAGIKTVALCDADPFCRQVLNKNFPGVPIFEADTFVTLSTLAQVGVTKVDIVAGGFPCQAWSLAGKRGGDNDPRHRWPEMHRIIGDLLPTWVFGENVRGLVSGGGLDAVCTDLEALSYEVWPVVLPTGAAVGSPHKRERVFILAHRECIRWDRRAGKVYSTEGRGQSEDSRVSGEAARAAQPRVGRVLDGLSARLDGHLWPAGRGEPQFDWEPPRLTRTQKWRGKRLRVLGNSAVPQALYPLFASMVAISEEL